MLACCVPLWWLAAVAQQIHLRHEDFSVLYEEMGGRGTSARRTHRQRSRGCGGVVNPQGACRYPWHLRIRDCVCGGAKDLAVAEVAAARSLVLDAHGGASGGRCAAGETGAAGSRAVGVGCATQVEEVQPVTGGSGGGIGPAAPCGPRACCLCDTTVSPTGKQTRVSQVIVRAICHAVAKQQSGAQRAAEALAYPILVRSHSSPSVSVTMQSPATPATMAQCHIDDSRADVAARLYRWATAITHARTHARTGIPARECHSA